MTIYQLPPSYSPPPSLPMTLSPSLPPKPLSLLPLPLPLSSSTTFTAVLLLLSALLCASFSSAATFSNCDRTFNCGPLQNISYPFTGGERPDYCGPTQFRLTCRDNAYVDLTINSLTYRVLQINQTRETLVLARPDLWNNTCPEKFVNATLDSPVFSYGIDNVELNLFYGCSWIHNFTPYNSFSCAVRGVNYTDGFYLVGPVPSDPILQNLSTCHVSVAVPVTGVAARKLTANLTTTGEALMQGFNVNYTDPYASECSKCILFGRQCGFDPDLGEPICICGNRRCSIPSVRGSSSQETKPSKLAFFIPGAILAGLGMGWIIFACRQWRKRIPRNDDQSTSAESQRKDIPFLPLRKKSFTPTTSTYFSQSIPSVSSSNSDVGKASSYFGVQIFTYTELEEATNNFDRSRELGDGGFGAVYYGKLQDGRVVAVKRLYENNFKRVEQFMNEVEILTRLRHENLVTLYGCTSRRSRELLLVYEYIPNGTVADHLHGKRKNSGLLTWPIRLNIAIETADALAYLHASDIIHRDVKTTNVLLDNDFRVKVVDFGLSRLFPNDVTHVSTAPQGTPGYVDPEYYQCYQLTEKSDVYSFGVVLIELISSKEAVDTNRERHDINLSNMAINKIQNGALHELVDPALGFETNGSVRRMITLVGELAFRCLQKERDLRPSMKELVGALRRIKEEDLKAEPGEVVEVIVEDDVGRLKGNPPPPDS